MSYVLDSTKLTIANNLSDLNNAVTARTNLGLGNAATLNTGVSNGAVIVADATGLPAINGSQLTNLPSSGGGFTYSAITSLITAQAEYYYSCDGTFTVTLPAASCITAGKEIRIKNMGTGTITIARSSTDTIDGQTSAALGVQYQMLSFISNGVDAYEVI